LDTAQLSSPTYEACARLAEAGDHEAAVEAYAAFLREHPADGRALNDLGSLLFATGRLEEAAVHLEGAARRLDDDGRPLALWNLAEVYLASRRPNKVLGLFDDLHAGETLNAELANRTAKAFLDAGEPGGAVETLLATRAALPGQEMLTEFIDAIRSQRPNVAFFSDTGDTKFLAEIYPWTEQRFPARMWRSSTREHMLETLKWCDIAWFEWCTPQVVLASHLPKTCRTVVRLHRYEAFRDWPSQVNWDNIDFLVTVGNSYVLKRVLDRVPDLHERTRVLSIPNGVNLDRFALRERPRGKNVAMVGYLNLRKNPGLLLQCFARLYREDPEYHLHIAGDFQDDGLLFDYVHQMLRELGLKGAVTFHGWQQDVAAWLEDKHYLVSTAMGEGHPVNVIEAMASGIKPVIHTWPGARAFFPPECLWRDPDEFCRCILEGEYEPRFYRDWVARRYSLQEQLARINAVFSHLEREIRAEETEGAHAGPADAEEAKVPNAANAPETREARAFYDQWYHGAVVVENHCQKARRETVVRALAALDRTDLEMIDLGCGLGQLEPHLVPFGRVTGVDLSEEAVRTAQRYCPEATFVRGDVQTMMLPEAAYDVVLSIEVIEHFDDDGQVHHLARAWDLLVPGGRLVLTTPNRPIVERINAEAIARTGRPWTDQPIENWLDEAGIRRLVQAAGFVVESQEIFTEYDGFEGFHTALVARKPADGQPAGDTSEAPRVHPAVHPAPVLVLGNQKSGTTAIAALLARAADKTYSYDVFNRLGAERSLERLIAGETEVRDFVAAHPHDFATDVIKAPPFGLIYDGLREVFPDGRFIFIVRDPRENIRSILDRLGLPGDLPALGPKEQEAWADLPGWRLIMEGRTPPTAGANYIETLASRWNRFADVYLRNPDRLECVRYEDFCADKTGTVTDLARRLGWEVVRDVSGEVNRQYQRAGQNRGTPWRDFFGHENLERIERTCGERMQAFGYPLDADGQ
jgi:glycosyltransferase involved in cell wall biosynthesis/2-polyprenyl-3-methyl-5-hydroxy-6-metoxy-1,4-benzoquinol methylase